MSSFTKRTLITSLFLTFFVGNVRADVSPTYHIRLTPADCKGDRPLRNWEVPPGKKVCRIGFSTLAGANPAEAALDIYCTELLMRRLAPNGGVTVFGSARTKPGDSHYESAREFGRKWSQVGGKYYPLLVGAGNGIMEAVPRGAKEVGGRSIGLAMRIPNEFNPSKPNPYVTDYYVFRSMDIREGQLIDRGKAVVIYIGGFGTEWELYETLCKIQTRLKAGVPVIMVGTPQEQTATRARLAEFANRGTISDEDLKLVEYAETPDQIVGILSSRLLTQLPPPIPDLP